MPARIFCELPFFTENSENTSNVLHVGVGYPFAFWRDRNVRLRSGNSFVCCVWCQAEASLEEKRAVFDESDTDMLQKDIAEVHRLQARLTYVPLSSPRPPTLSLARSH